MTMMMTMTTTTTMMHCCHHHHDEHEHDHDHHHHHHHDGEECDDPHCGCHHHHHHADEVFTSWGAETVKAYSEAELEHILTALDSGEYGAILRAKGIVAAADGGQWLHYDFVPEEHQVRLRLRRTTPAVSVRHRLPAERG